MEYEVAEDRKWPGDWRVTAINHAGDGEIYTAIFVGHEAEGRAREYARRSMSTQERVKLLTEATPNTWVALSHDESRLVAQGDDYAQAVESAGEAGESDPILILIPHEWNPMA